MESINIQLHKANDAEDGYALRTDQDAEERWRAKRGYGSEFQIVWSVELQSQELPNLDQVDWDAVLERTIEAHDLNDPVITDFQWPLRQAA
jgi:hypothetical protein